MSQPDRPWDAPPKPKGQGDQVKGKLIVGAFVVAAVAVVGIAAAVSDSGKTATPATDEGTEYGATDVCHTFVEQRLKSPSSADFDDSASGYGDSWTVSGRVDSDKSFGASMRNDFTCKVSYVSDGNWHLESLTGLLN